MVRLTFNNCLTKISLADRGIIQRIWQQREIGYRVHRIR
jgi:hypothetical protein